MHPQVHQNVSLCPAGPLPRELLSCRKRLCSSQPMPPLSLLLLPPLPRGCTRDATEGHLDKCLPALFTRAVDPKQPLREQACDLLGLLQASFPREALLGAAERTVERHRVAKAKARAVEFGNEIVRAAALGSVDNGTGTVLVAMLKTDSTVLSCSSTTPSIIMPVLRFTVRTGTQGPLPAGLIGSRILPLIVLSCSLNALQ